MFSGAAHVAESARRLDLQDRYLNSVAVKALLAAGHTAAAERTAVLFTRETGADGAATLFDMQHMWYDNGQGGLGLAHGSLLDLEQHRTEPPVYAIVARSFLSLRHTLFQMK